MARADTRGESAVLGGLDGLRVFAAVLMTAEHALSLAGLYRWTMIGSINVGQLGVSLFLGISAVLAVRSERPISRWVWRRLYRIFPAYWIVILASFVLTWSVHYRRFGVYQVISQLAGVGLFTHPDSLVNEPTWYISLILCCYLGHVACRSTHWPALANGVFAVGFLSLVLIGFRPWITMHMMTFFAVSAVASLWPGCLRNTRFLLAGLVSLLAAGIATGFAYLGIALLAIWGSLFVQRESRCLRMAAKHVYEYYLIHGLALFGMIRVLELRTVFATMIGIAVAIIGAVLLQVGTEMTVVSIRRSALRLLRRCDTAPLPNTESVR